jgi:hypothetical protein
MPEVVEEVRIDFKTLSVLSKETREAAKNAAVLSKHFSQLNKDAGQIAKMLNAPTGLPKAAKDSAGLRANLKESGLAIAAIGTAASAAFFKMAQLANPAAVERLNRALRDTTAVLGHTLTPYLEVAERGVRRLGDTLANQPPEVQTAAGGLLAAGATIATGAAVLQTGSWIYGQYKGAYGGAKNAYRAATTRPPPVPPPVPRVSSLDAAMGIPYQGRTAGPPPVPRPTTLGRVGTFLGRAALPVGIGLEAYGAYSEYRQGDYPALQSRVISGTGGPPVSIANEPAKGIGTRLGLWLTRQIYGEEESNAKYEQLRRTSAYGLNPWYEPNLKTSFGAAAQPAEYQDVLGAIMSMRQSVASGAGNDPASQTAENTGKTASLLEQILSGPAGAGFGVASEVSSTVAGWFGAGKNTRGTGSR